MKRRQWLTAGVAAAAGVAGAGWAAWRSQQAGPAQDAGAGLDAFWALQFEQPGGGQLKVAALRGKPLLVNFWATWCAPCVREMPLLDAFSRLHQVQGWQVIGLAVDGPTPVREFLAKLPVAFPIGLAGLNGVDLAHSLGNDQGGLPFTVIFDRRGALVDRKLGAVSDANLSDWVQRLT